jgi:CRISPR system Cascade subunit CasC
MTMSPRFLQIHTLTSYPGALLNRDDAGFAKRLPFGGVSRLRISSQCLKRHWRTFEGEHSLAELGPMSVRSRHTFERLLVQPLLADQHEEKVVRPLIEAMVVKLLGESAKAKKEKDGADSAEKKPAKKGKAEKEEGMASLQTGQVTVLGRPEVSYLLTVARELLGKISGPDQVKAAVEEAFKNKDFKKNLDALRLAAGLDAALFGRMVTSDVLARGDAAIHVAHAFTVHQEESEADYFSAIDDLEKEDGKLGSGHINSTELTSGLFYGYVAIDLPLLVSNLEGCDRKEWLTKDRQLAAQVIERLIHLVATVSPGAKLGSTAPHSYASLVLVEAGKAQPCTLANAFLEPTSLRGDLLSAAYGDLARHVTELDEMYGRRNERMLAARGPHDKLTGVATRQPLAGVAAWAAKQVQGNG